MPARKIDGKWWVDTWVHPPGKPRVRLRKKSPVNTKAGAQEYEKGLVASALSTSTPSTPVPTLETFAAEFLSVYVQNNNKHSEAVTKEMILSMHLVPFFGATPLDQINARQVEAYKAQKKTEKKHRGTKLLGLKTINNHLLVLSKVLTVAKAWGIIPHALKILRFKLPEPPFDFLTFEESARLIAAASPGLWQTFLLVACRTGLRLGEMLALTWADVLFDQRRLKVRQSMTRKRIGTPKSGKSRDVPLSPDALAALEAWKKTSLGPYVFSEKAGAWSTKGQVEWAIECAYKAAGLRKISTHVLRHTFASQLAMRGASLKAIQEMMGHSDLTMTMRYAHLSAHVAQDAVALLDVTSKAVA